MLRRVVQLLDLLFGKVAHAARRIAQPQFTCANDLARRDHGASANHCVRANVYAIEHGGVHADQARVLDGTGMQDCAMTNRDIGADRQRESTGRVRTIVSDVQYGTILNVRTRADANEIHVAARHRARPQRGVVAKFDIADKNGSRIDVNVGANARKPIAIRTDIHIQATPEMVVAMVSPHHRTTNRRATLAP